MQSDSNTTSTRNTESDFKNLTDLSPTATCIVVEGKVIYMNPAGFVLFGVEASGEIIGKSFLFLFHPDRRDNIAEEINLFKKNSLDNSLEIFEAEEKLNRADGNNVTASVAMRKILFRGAPAMLIVFHDITELKNTENELRISQEHYRSLLSKLPDYVFIQVEGKIVYVNESMLKAGNYEAEEMLNKSVFDFIDDKYHKFVVEKINRRLSGSQSEPIEIEIILKSGERRAVLTKGEIIRYEDKNALLIVSVDITHRKQAEEQLKSYAEELKKNKELLEEKAALLAKSETELKKLNTSKDKFFSIIAHDLKGPFNGLLGYTNFLAYDIDALEAQEISQFARDINSSALSIYNLLTNLLEWARVQTDGNYCKPEKLKLIPEVEEIINVLGKNIEAKSLKVQVDIDNQITVFSDKHMLRSIVQNLMANAVKFTGQGGKINLRAVRNNGFIETSVTDNGIGINPELLHKLFKIDQNISTYGTNAEKGTGLGLILCKEFVEINGGRIWVESQLGKGSSFTFTLPAAS